MIKCPHVKPRRSSLLSRHVLSSLDVGEEDLVQQLYHKHGSKLLLGRYSSEEILQAIRRTGVEESLLQRGITPIKVDIDSSDPYHQRVIFTCRGERIGEVILNVQAYHIKSTEVIEAGLEGSIRVLVVEWLVLELPSFVKAPHHPRFPGQRRPGLGIGKKVLELLSTMARQMHLDAIIAFPEFYHNAVLYAHYFKFLSPVTEGRFQAMMRDLSKYELREVSFAFAGGVVKEKHNHREKFIEWVAEEMAHPVSQRMKTYFSSPGYLQKVKEVEKQFSYEVDWEAFRKKEKKIKQEF